MVQVVIYSQATSYLNCRKLEAKILVTWTSILCRLCSKGFFLTLKLRNYKYSSLSSPIELVSSKRHTLACAPIEDSDQSAHMRSLIRVFYGRSTGNQGSLHFFMQKTKTLVRLLDCADSFEFSLFAHANLYMVPYVDSGLILISTVNNTHKLS